MQSVTLDIPEDDTQTIYDEDALCGIRHYTGTIILDDPHLWNGLKDPFYIQRRQNLRKTVI